MNYLYLRQILASVGVNGFPPLRQYKPKEPRKCLLPDCQRTTLHNGGYCSPDHYKKHKIKLKQN